MSQENYAQSRQRFFTRILRQVASEEQLTLHFFSKDWIARLSDGRRQRFVYGYQFDLNSVTAQMLAFDKAATSTLLAESGVPAVAHRLFLRPEEAGWVGDQGVWPALQAYAQEHQFDIVAKPNRGTRGQSVYFIRTPRELEAAAHQLWALDRAFCLSPRETIETEYRLLMLDKEPQLVYAKRIPFLEGDGKSTLADLFDGKDVPPWLDPQQVPAEGEQVPLLQKSNLSGGAMPEILLPADVPELVAIARQAVRAIGMRFASVDIIRTADQGEKVLEINSGLVGGAFIRQAPEGYERAKAVYRAVVQKMFDR